VGDFWAGIEDPPLAVPGAWVDDDSASVCSDYCNDDYPYLDPYFADTDGRGRRRIKEGMRGSLEQRHFRITNTKNSTSLTLVLHRAAEHNLEENDVGEEACLRCGWIGEPAAAQAGEVAQLHGVHHRDFNSVDSGHRCCPREEKIRKVHSLYHEIMSPKRVGRWFNTGTSLYAPESKFGVADGDSVVPKN